jgi:hypothetical protein
MNVILIYPEFPDTFWSFKHALRFIQKKASSPPLGCLHQRDDGAERVNISANCAMQRGGR